VAYPERDYFHSTWADLIVTALVGSRRATTKRSKSIHSCPRV
jgi:hypothetical protein